ncbi:AdoMet-dependent proline di-methyltransferase (macronuclear) [Tetrahymena thermophila SB210]|uniref:Alpha N-terminal protein methyltransferase 1 n=1 Tax=Tetrahymena thermophila (strain SB210) TaxID=312017 RepID=W7X1L8_TETTS|nr:AdoMet-dependent proline di-methyltransferase [Tetrahymena thermophila SB210]EWS73135.1 AdoMet-dependent proline di-methyltransferase [Tetrahymena thermophila SB210]|eukprot:XP_012654322.1 AdoMet-dependent proline di-methyltransferase [Tetrahymena thermophila SB210]
MILKNLFKRKPILYSLPFLISYPQFSNYAKTQQKHQNQEEQLKNLWDGDDEFQKEWYSKGNQYWQTCESNYDGVMGGYGHLNDLDIKFSRYFLQQLQEKFPQLSQNFNRALDCGAGIGRVTKELLMNVFQKVDLLEQCDKYIFEAKNQLKQYPNVEDFYQMGLQEFQFQKQYDCIWIQWVSNQIKDDDYVRFLQKCSNSLSQDGFIIVKENISEEGFILDSQDYSITRSDSMYKQLFSKANLDIILEKKQPEFPDELFDVKMYALKRISENKNSIQQ